MQVQYSMRDAKKAKVAEHIQVQRLAFADQHQSFKTDTSL